MPERLLNLAAWYRFVVVWRRCRSCAIVAGSVKIYICVQCRHVHMLQHMEYPPSLTAVPPCMIHLWAAVAYPSHTNLLPLTHLVLCNVSILHCCFQNAVRSIFGTRRPAGHGSVFVPLIRPASAPLICTPLGNVDGTRLCSRCFWRWLIKGASLM